MGHFFLCSDCGKKFKQESQLKDQRRYHDKKESACPVCDEVFLNKRYMKFHSAKHNEDKTFNCSSCQEEFKSQQS